jgi:hypothetical protein
VSIGDAADVLSDDEIVRLIKEQFPHTELT